MLIKMDASLRSEKKPVVLINYTPVARRMCKEQYNNTSENKWKRQDN
jgi:hypothetical protein